MLQEDSQLISRPPARKSHRSEICEAANDKSRRTVARAVRLRRSIWNRRGCFWPYGFAHWINSTRRCSFRPATIAGSWSQVVPAIIMP
jgi:hypothetical protein